MICLNDSPKCLGSAATRGLCRSCYKKEYRKANKEKLRVQEKLRRTKNISNVRTQMAKYKRTDKGRYASALCEAKRRGLIFSINFDDFCALLKEPCYYCETEATVNYGHRLDRIENSMGYSLANVVPCCGPCNKIRGDNLTFLEMTVAMKVIVEFRKPL